MPMTQTGRCGYPKHDSLHYLSRRVTSLMWRVMITGLRVSQPYHSLRSWVVRLNAVSVEDDSRQCSAEFGPDSQNTSSQKCDKCFSITVVQVLCSTMTNSTFRRIWCNLCTLFTRLKMNLALNGACAVL